MTNNIYKAEVSGKIRAFESDARRYYKFGPTINGTITGSPTINNGVVSSFTKNNYINSYLPIPQEGIDTFEIYSKFTTGSTLDDYMDIISPICDSSTSGYRNFKFEVAGYSELKHIALVFHPDNNEDWIHLVAKNEPEINTTYWCKWIYDGTDIKSYYSTDGVDYILNRTNPITNDILTCLSKLESGDIKIGVNQSHDYPTLKYPFTGSIDLTKTYIKINDKIIWSGTYPEVSNETDYVYYKDIKEYKLLKI